MGHKYINTETFEIVNNIFEVDEDIAETISTLNKKGYYTKFCCSGHIKDPRLYELYNIKKDENFYDKHLGHIINNNKKDSYDILVPYTFTSVYIMFDDEYNFNNLPNGFEKINSNTIEMIIDYYRDGKKKNMTEIDKEIKMANKILLEWAISLIKNF